MRRETDQAGFALIITLIALVLVTVFIVAINRAELSNLIVGSNGNDFARALNAAESGASEMSIKLKQAFAQDINTDISVFSYINTDFVNCQGGGGGTYKASIVYNGANQMLISSVGHFGKSERRVTQTVDVNYTSNGFWSKYPYYTYSWNNLNLSGNLGNSRLLGQRRYLCQRKLKQC